MKFGAVFPQTEIGSDPQAIQHYFAAIEAMGYDYVLAYDHVTGANPDRPGGWQGPYTHHTPFHEILTLFAFGAATTHRLEFASGILILPQRQTALVAKQAAQVDLFSGGRLRLGVAVGWNRVEMESLGEDFSTRGARIEEQVDLLRKLWTQDLVRFESDRHHFDDIGINPLPVQRPIPVWFGGGAEVVLERTARLGDGWMPNSRPMEESRAEVAMLKEYLTRYGRTIGDGFGMDVRLNYSRQPEADWKPFVDEWLTLGATHFAMNTMGAGLTTLDEHFDVLGRFMRFAQLNYL